MNDVKDNPKADEQRAEADTGRPEPPAKPKAEEFQPRRLMVVVGGPRGDFLADADTGEDLRLPMQAMRVEWASVKSHADASFLVQTPAVSWREWKARVK